MVDSMEVKKLTAEVQQLEACIASERAAAGKSSRTTLCFAGVLAAIVLAFLVINYVRVRQEFTEENIARSLEQEIHEISPTALRQINMLGQDLLPVYAAEWKKQLEAAWPEISQRIQTEFGKLAGSLTEQTHATLAETENRLLSRLTDVVVRSYPDLGSPTRRAEIEKRVHLACDSALEKALLDFDGLFSKDVDAFQRTLRGFNLSDGKESKLDLQKKFLHLWLQLLDQEIMKI